MINQANLNRLRRWAWLTLESLNYEIRSKCGFLMFSLICLTYEKGVNMEVKSKIDDIIEMTRINELLDKREAANAKKPSNVILWALAVLGSISAVAIISYLVYRYMTPAFEDDYYDDDFDDFDDDFDDEDFIKES